MKELPEPSAQLIARFRSRLVERVVVEELGPCLEMSGYRDSDGYCRFYVGENHYAAHRLGLFWLGGERVATELQVLHRCDNQPCCNHQHLVQGTSAQNSTDMAIKGRAHRMQGDKHPCAKVTEAQVRSALILYRDGQKTIRALAAELGVTRSTLRRIFRGERWAHLNLAG